MPQIASPLQDGKYPTLLTYNFYDAPQCATYHPVAAITSPKLSVVPATESRKEVGVSSLVGTPLRQPGRQVEWADRVRAKEIHCWLDNLHLRLENYVAVKGKSGITGFPLCPAFERASASVPSAQPPIQKKRGRPKKVVANRLKPYLQNFILAREALQALSGFDDIVHGAVRLDAGGNTRPLSKTMMVSLLQVLDEITTEAVRESIGGSVRHAQRVAMCLRVIERTAYKVAQIHWYVPTEADWSDLD